MDWLSYAQLEGADVRFWIGRPEVRVLDLVKMLRGAAVTVAALHAAGWVHGAISPERLLVSATGEVSLTGFGAAYRPMQESPYARSREAGFTPLMEGATDQPGLADVWSIAAVGAWALTGLPPVPAGSAEAVAALGSRLDRITTTAQLAPGAPDALTAILDDILFQSSSDRPLEAAEFADALERVEQSLSFTDQQVSLFELRAQSNGERYGHNETGPLPAVLPQVESQRGTARTPGLVRDQNQQSRDLFPGRATDEGSSKGFRGLTLALSLTALALAAAALIWVIARTPPADEAERAAAGSGQAGSGAEQAATGTAGQAGAPGQNPTSAPQKSGSGEAENPAPPPVPATPPVPEPPPVPALPPLPPLTADEPAAMEGGTVAQGRTLSATTPEKIGEIVWRTELKDGLLVAPLVVAGRVFAVSSTGRVVALDARDGRELWRAQLRSEEVAGVVRVSSGIAVANGKVAVLSDLGTLATFAADSGRELWKREVGEGSWGGISAMDRKLYLATKSGQVSAFADLDGSTLWTFPAGGEVRSRMSSANGMLFVAALSGGICENSCSYRNDGQCDDGGSITASNLCSLGTDCADCGPRTRVARNRRETGAAQTQLIAIDVGLGQERWRQTLDAGVSTEMIAQGSTLFVTDWSGRVSSRNAATGAAGAEVKLAGRSFVDGGSLGPAGLLLPSTDGSLTLLNSTTLAEIWKSQLPAKPAAAAVQTENMALIPLANNVLTALSLRTGIAAWRFETRFLTAASATATDQVTIFGNTAGSIYAIK
jgi:outer membrane protein assembly factor BamB